MPSHDSASFEVSPLHDDEHHAADRDEVEHLVALVNQRLNPLIDLAVALLVDSFISQGLVT
jgi:hypothetical protein